LAAVKEACPVTIQEIQQQVCAAYGVSLIELLSQRRQRAIIEPRWVAIWLCRETTGHSLPAIGRAFGGRDHTTVMHALQRVDGRMLADAAFAARVQQLRGDGA